MVRFMVLSFVDQFKATENLTTPHLMALFLRMTIAFAAVKTMVRTTATMTTMTLIAYAHVTSQ